MSDMISSPPRPQPSSSKLRPVSDSFRPRFPSDPFSDLASHRRDPIVLCSERLRHISQPRRDVILVLGVPGPSELAPLFNSERLAFSLLIIVSHQPPLIPPMVQPVIRILRLTEPLGVENAGALRLVNVLEWAERVARIWRNVGGIGMRELAECNEEEDFGVLTPPPNLLRQLSKSSPPSSASSKGDSTVSSISTIFSGKLHSLKKYRFPSRQALPIPDPSQRPFDALINYLPAGISDKALLKQAILVTTISRPFLIAPIPSSHPRRLDVRRNFLSMLCPAYAMPPTPPLGSVESLNNLVTSPFSQGPPIKPHLVHLLPPRPRGPATNCLLESIEAFLLSFSFPPRLQAKKEVQLEPARTYLLDSAAFTEPIGGPPNLVIKWTVTDVLLSGCLDDEPMPRVWLSGAADIVVSALPPLQSSPTTPPVESPPTPPHSEEDSSCRHNAPMLGKRSLRWKFLKWHPGRVESS